jgi:hypothetical protein
MLDVFLGALGAAFFWCCVTALTLITLKGE